MAKKAKLDILEITPEELGDDTRQDEATASQGIQNGPTGEQTSGAFSSKALEWARKPLFLLILISLTLLGLTTGILICYYQGIDGEVPAGQKRRDVSALPSPEEAPGAFFEGLVVDQKDENGNIRILFCDVALELTNRNGGAIAGDRTDVRGVIYGVLKKVPAQAALLPEGRGRVKETLKSELNGLFGTNLVKEVYFTRYELN